MGWTTSGDPWTSFNLATTGTTENNTIDSASINVGPSFMRTRVDSSSSGGIGSSGLQVMINIGLKQT